MVDWKNYTIGTLTMILLISLGFVVTDADTHFCRDLGIAKQCDRLSSTYLTCYPYESTTIGKKYCPSAWEVIYQIPQNITIIYEIAEDGRWTCDQIGCKPELR